MVERNKLKIVSRDNNEECYVYLMIDTTNNFHKIGMQLRKHHSRPNKNGRFERKEF